MSDGRVRPLLVPIDVEALIIGASSSTGTDWVNLKPDFRQVYSNYFLGQQLEGEPCVDTDAGLSRKPGVHLHWALPDGLTHGVVREQGAAPDFPLVPNRWVVVRVWGQAAGTLDSSARCKAWVVESDVVVNENGTIWPSPRLGSPDPAKEQDYSVRVGRRKRLDEWNETAGPSIDLTAVGYGDPSFAAYYPASGGMLGFYDDELAASSEPGSLTYFVAGWYSDPAKDPLHAALESQTLARLQDFLAETKWVYPGFDEAADKAERFAHVVAELQESRDLAERLAIVKGIPDTERAELDRQISELASESNSLAEALKALSESFPVRIVCHGVISGIAWRGANARYDRAVPGAKAFRLAVGNTAVEALTALFQSALEPGVTKLLEAFQYDLVAELEKPYGDERLQQKIHERGYRPLSRGIRWDVVQQPRGQHNGSSEEDTPPIPGDVRLLLEKLNIRQREINRLERSRDSRKSELYAAWYRKILDGDNTTVAGQIIALQEEIADLTRQLGLLDDTKENRPAGPEWGALQAGLRTLLPGYSVQPLEEFRFWRPNDPLVLLAGPAFQPVSRHGQDGQYRADGRLLCRLGGQVLTGVELTIPHAKVDRVVFGGADVDIWCKQFQGDAARLPSDVRESVLDLFREALLLTLDTNRARDVAIAAFERNEQGLAKDQAGVARFATALITYTQRTLQRAKETGDDGSPAPASDSDTSPASGAFGFVGTFPSPVALNLWEGNPWLPLFLQWQVSWQPAYSDTSAALQNWTLDQTGTVFSALDTAPAETQPNSRTILRGTSVLTPGAAVHLSDRLRQYNQTHDSPQLKAFQTAVGSMSLLGQTLGGFTDNLLMRKARLEIRPLDPGSEDRGPEPSTVYDWVKDIDWLAPLSDAELFPIRAGRLSIDKVWIVDAFGQLLQLETIPPAAALQPVPHRSLAGRNGEIRLQPRLAQPARLFMEWLPAEELEAPTEQRPAHDGERFDPVCGWIVPNLLDRGLMIYDARGRALGALQAVQQKSWSQGAGAIRKEIESFHWVDIPGSRDFFFGKPPQQITDPLGEGANRHLRDYVRGLLQLKGASGAGFGRLLDRMDETLTAGDGASTRNPGLTMLIGRPLALVRAMLRLELDGDPALHQGDKQAQWDTATRTRGIERVKFPVRLGDRRQWNGLWLGDDGLAGFFLSADYSHFYPAYGLEGDNDDYSTYRYAPAISIDEPLHLTLLMDASRGVCATTGILPRIAFNLPYGDLTETLENSQVLFFTGPLVSTADAVRMPQPSDLYGQWSWTHHPAVEVWHDDAITDTRKEEGRFFDDSLQISDGWLKLVTTPVDVRILKVKGREPVSEQKAAKAGEPDVPAVFEAVEGEITLSWAAVGADQIELMQDSTLSVIKSARHPLPTQCVVTVQRDTSFTLVATGRAATLPDARNGEQRVAAKTIRIRIVPIVH